MLEVIENDVSFAGKLVYNNIAKYIILHHADASICTVEDIHRWHLENGWIGIGYHYFIRKNGKIYRGRPETAQGSHTKTYNTQSIGICLEGNFSNEKITEEQKQSLEKLILDIRGRHGDLKVLGHKDVNNTSCPGKNFPLDYFKNFKTEELSWKQKIVKEAFEKKLITDSKWIEKAEEKPEIWFVLAVILNLLKILKEK